MTATIDGALWATADAILARMPAARLKAQRLRDWARRGLIRSVRIGKECWYALTDVQRVERDTRQAAAKRGGARRGQVKRAA